MRASISELKRREICWSRCSIPASWVANVDGQDCHLTMNDFPEEPLFTISYMGETADLDDAPEMWVIPYD